MIKLKFLLNLLVLPVAFLSAGAQVTAKQSTASFGRFGNDCSTGRGVCAFSAQQAVATRTTASSAEKKSDNSFVLKIKRTSLTVKDEGMLAGKTFSEINTAENVSFQQLDAIVLDNATLTNLGLDKSLNKIAAGYYPMVIFSDYVEVTFTTVSSN